MKVLWFSNKTIIGEATDAAGKRYMGAGWVKALEGAIGNNETLELGFAFPDKTLSKLKKEDIEGRTVYRIPFPDTKFKRWKNRFFNTLESDKVIDVFVDIVNDYRPDLVHVYGTEHAFGEITDKVNVPVLIDFQGILSAITPKWFAGISAKQAYKHAKLFSKLNYNTHYHTYRDSLKRAAREKRIIARAKYITGRTDWDRSVAEVYSNGAHYYHCERVIRKAFWEASWKPEYKNETIFFSVMNNNMYKGLDVIYKTAARLSAKKIPYKWLVAGISPNMDMVPIVEKVTGIRTSDIHVDLVGRMKEDQLCEVLEKSTFFIHPSYIDNSPNTVNEALVAGVPVIATAVGGIPTVLRHSETGWLIQEGDDMMLAGLIIRLLNNKESIMKVAKQGLEEARNRHNPQQVVDTIISIYQDILDKEAGGKK